MIVIQFKVDDLIILKNEQRKVIDLKITSFKLLVASQAEREFRLQAMGFIGR